MICNVVFGADEKVMPQPGSRIRTQMLLQEAGRSSFLLMGFSLHLFIQYFKSEGGAKLTLPFPVLPGQQKLWGRHSLANASSLLIPVSSQTLPPQEWHSKITQKLGFEPICLLLAKNEIIIACGFFFGGVSTLKLTSFYLLFSSSSISKTMPDM